jgi:hypothetical protein
MCDILTPTLATKWTAWFRRPVGMQTPVNNADPIPVPQTQRQADIRWYLVPYFSMIGATFVLFYMEGVENQVWQSLKIRWQWQNCGTMTNLTAKLQTSVAVHISKTWRFMMSCGSLFHPVSIVTKSAQGQIQHSCLITGVALCLWVRCKVLCFISARSKSKYRARHVVV